MLQLRIQFLFGGSNSFQKDEQAAGMPPFLPSLLPSGIPQAVRSLPVGAGTAPPRVIPWRAQTQMPRPRCHRKSRLPSSFEAESPTDAVIVDEALPSHRNGGAACGRAAEWPDAADARACGGVVVPSERCAWCAAAVARAHTQIERKS